MRMDKLKIVLQTLLFTAMLGLLPEEALAMHISEGILPAGWAALWFAAIVPFMVRGLFVLRKAGRESAGAKPLLGVVGAAVFIISCMPIPIPFAGTCSHPCGTGLAALIVGPALAVVLASVALLLQALFLAHGGFTTLGANLFSMGVAGAFTGYGVFVLSRSLGIPRTVGLFLAGLLSDWATYAVTSFQLASTLAAPGGFEPMFVSLLVAFAPMQIPIGIIEGFLCVGAYRFIRARRPELLAALWKEAA